MVENEETRQALGGITNYEQRLLSTYSRLGIRFLQLAWWDQVLIIGLLSIGYVFLAGKIGVLGITAFRGWSGGIPPNLQVAPDDWSALFARWDSFYYLEIATLGYQSDPSAQAFFPLYPLAVRLANVVTGIPLLWTGLFISAACFLGTGLVMYKWLRADYEHGRTLAAVMFMYIFPVAYYFVGFYAEPLFMLLCVLSLCLARYGRFGASGLAIALAGAARPQAFILVVPYCLEFYQHRSFTWKNWLDFGLGALLAPVGTLAYWVYMAQQSSLDAPDVYTDLLRQHWHTYMAPPWVTLLDGLGAVLFGINIQPDWFSRAYCLHDLAYALFGLAIAIGALGRVRASTAGFLLASVLFFFSVHGPYGYAFDSMPRHIASLPPVFLCLALVQSRLPARLQWIPPTISLLGLGVLAAWFASGRWVS